MLKMYDFWNTLRLMRRMRKKEVVKFSLATALVATTMLPTAAWAAENEDFYGNERLGASSLLSGVTVTLSDGKTEAKATNYNTVSENDTTWRKVYGVYASTGLGLTASNNAVYMSAGEVKCTDTKYPAAVAGCSFSGTNCTAQSNTVTITDSSKVTGAVYGGSGAYALSNTATVTDSTVTGSVYGGNSGGKAQDNKAIVTDSTVTGNVYGGSTSGTTGEMLSNTATITNSTVSGYVYGGSNSTTSNTDAAKYNTATITGSTVTIQDVAQSSGVAGCLNSGSGDVVNNTLTITGSTVTIGSKTQNDKQNIGVYGSYKSTNYAGTAEGNTVTIKDESTVTIRGKDFIGVYGNRGGGTAKSNAVKITDSTVNITSIMNGNAKSGIFGSFGDSSTTAEGNTVTITNSTVGIEAKKIAGIYGGNGGTVTGNTVTIDGGSKVTITTLEGGSNCGIYGGYGSTVTGNTVSIEGGSTTVSSDVYGGYGSSSKLTVTGNTVTIKSGSTVSGNVYGGYSSSSSGTATGNTVAIVANSTEGVPTLTSANFYGSNKAATGATGKNANTLDLSGVTTALTVKSISNFDAITMGTGVVTVTAASDLTNTIIDATVITSLTEDEKANGRTLLLASGEGVKFTTNDSTKVTVSDALKEYIVDTTAGVTGGVVTRGYKGDITETKISIVKGDLGTNVAGVYYDSAGKGYNATDLTSGTATSGTLTIDGTLDTTGKIYAGAYAEGSATATGGTVAIGSSANVTGDLYAGYSASGKVESNTMTVAAGATLANAKLYGSNNGSGGTNNNNTLDLSAVVADLTANSINNFDSVKMGVGVLTVTSNSVLSFTNIDATAIKSLTDKEKTNGRNLLVANGAEFYTGGTYVTVSDELMALNEYAVYKQTGVAGGIAVTGYMGKIEKTKISIVNTEGANVAGLYIASNGKGYAVADDKVVEATSGTLTVSGDVTETGKTYYGAYAEGSSEAKGGKLEVKTNGEVGTVYGGYSRSGKVEGNTATIEGGKVSTVYGGNSDGCAVTGNTVSVTDGTVGAVYGGHSKEDNVESNTVNVTGGTLGSNNQVAAIYGCYSSKGAARNNTVNITGGTVIGKIIGGYSTNDTATGNKVILSGGTIGSSENIGVYGGVVKNNDNAINNTVAIVATDILAPDLTHANLYGTWEYVFATGKNNNTLDLTKMVVDRTANSINNFDSVKMGAGVLTVTASSDLSYATIDATAITSLSDYEKTNGRTLLQASGGGFITNASTTVTVSDELRALNEYVVYKQTGVAGGIAVTGYMGKIEAQKISIAKNESNNVAGLYIDSKGTGHAVSGSAVVEADKGILTISGDVTDTGKIYYGSYAEGSQTATDGTLEVKTGGVVAGKTYGGYSESGAVTGNTATIAGGEVDGKIYGGYSDGSGAVTGNTATMTNGTVDGKVLGGYSRSGKVEGNTANIAGGTVSVNVSGGSSDSGTSKGNKATVTGGTVNRRHGE